VTLIINTFSKLLCWAYTGSQPLWKAIPEVRKVHKARKICGGFEKWIGGTPATVHCCPILGAVTMQGTRWREAWYVVLLPLCYISLISNMYEDIHFKKSNISHVLQKVMNDSEKTLYISLKRYKALMKNVFTGNFIYYIIKHYYNHGQCRMMADDSNKLN